MSGQDVREILLVCVCDTETALDHPVSETILIRDGWESLECVEAEFSAWRLPSDFRPGRSVESSVGASLSCVSLQLARRPVSESSRMNSCPRIIVGDLCYLHDWDYSRPLPLNAGYVAAYLIEQQPDVEVDIFKRPRRLLERIDQDQPDILALSHYDWNSNLDLEILRRAKRRCPDTIGVLGGPNFEAQNLDWVARFLAARPEIDFYLVGEGEWSFHRLVELLREHDGRPGHIPVEELPSSCFSYDHEAQHVIHNPLSPVSRLDLTTVPSPYLTGLMDPFLADEQLAPIFETNRGCPYSCTFCCWGQATKSAVLQFPLDTVVEEIRYAAEHTRNRTGFMYIADGNFGIVPRDLEIADVLQECTERLQRPKRLFIYFAKNTNDRIIEIATKLNAVTSMSMSKQTLDPAVLANIERSNIPVEQYDRLRLECEKRGIDSFCELIYGLPGETYESYVQGVIATLRDGQRVTMYPHLMIHGADSSSQAHRKRFGIETAFRVIPTCISSYPELPCLEYEEVVIGTDTMPTADYFRMRLFQFLYFVLSREMFAELGRQLHYCGSDIATLADLIIRDDEQWPPLWRHIIAEHRKGVEAELISGEDLKLEFTAEDLDTVKSDRGLPSLLADSGSLDELRDYLADLCRRGYADRLQAADIDDLTTALDLSFDRIVHYDAPVPEKKVEYPYDIEAWLTSERCLGLSSYRTEETIHYLLQLDDDVLRVVEKSQGVVGDLPEALYRVRQSMTFGRSGDRLYTYRRLPLAEAARENHRLAEKQELDRQIRERHSELASR